ncbi:MAG: hypothetical protein RBT71_10880, partial [Flavobacteriales bacterium]|nr:hypothetical protein [Flavobacteriales bacterium]
MHRRDACATLSEDEQAPAIADRGLPFTLLSGGDAYIIPPLPPMSGWACAAAAFSSFSSLITH